MATRRNDHLFLAAIGDSMSGRPRLIIETMIRLVVIFVGLFMAWFGYINFLRGFGSFRMPSMTPIASLYAAIPISGALIALFAFEQLVNGWRNGFEVGRGYRGRQAEFRAMNNGTVLMLMTFLFLFFGYLGVPVAFSLMAGVIIGAAFTDVTFAADRAEDVRRRRFGGAARHSVLPAGRRADELGQRRAAA